MENKKKKKVPVLRKKKQASPDPQSKPEESGDRWKQLSFPWVDENEEDFFDPSLFPDDHLDNLTDPDPGIVDQDMLDSWHSGNGGNSDPD